MLYTPTILYTTITFPIEFKEYNIGKVSHSPGVLPF